MMNREIWKGLPESLGLKFKYEVSNTGKIRKVGPGKLPRGHIHEDGYESVGLKSRLSGKHKNFRVHILVAVTFIPNPYNKPWVDHINGDRRDNRVTNLRWATKSENALNRHSVKAPKGKSFPVARIDPKTGNVIRTWNTARDAAEETGIMTSDITRAIKRSDIIDGSLWIAYIEHIPDEIWLPVAGTNEQFHVSNMGRVRNGNGIPDYGSKSKVGYMTKSVSQLGRNMSVHILVCEAFHGSKPSSTHSVDHIDRNRTNNKSNNLKWASKTEQVYNRTAVQCDFNNIGRPTVKLDKNFQCVLGVYPGISTAARVNKLNVGNLGKVARLKTKGGGDRLCGDYLWIHVTPDNLPELEFPTCDWDPSQYPLDQLGYIPPEELVRDLTPLNQLQHVSSNETDEYISPEELVRDLLSIRTVVTIHDIDDIQNIDATPEERDDLFDANINNTNYRDVEREDNILG